jgi:hypothetical protein
VLIWFIDDSPFPGILLPGPYRQTFY